MNTENCKSPKPGNKVGEIRFGKWAANLIALLVGLVLIAAFLVFAAILPHSGRMDDFNILYFIGAVAVSAVLHECLHAVGAMRWGKLTRRDVKIRFSWRGLIPVCHCKAPVTVGAYRALILLPLYVLGSVFIILLTLFPSAWLALATGTLIAGSTGDMLILWKLRHFNSSYLIQDHPTEIGCDIFENPTP